MGLCDDGEDAEDDWIEGVACLPALEQLSFDCRPRIPSEFYALQLTSLSLNFDFFDADFASEMVEEVCTSASATCSLVGPADSHQVLQVC